ncbi:MAG: hypothetical protein KDA42_19425 [Planctomycetales bacterium]|nr:hypothetical protein [Planctomycetales bacterium]
MSTDRATAKFAPRRQWAGPAIVAAAFVGLAVWTWRRWADPLIDFGRELYVPWRLSEGDVLYRDLAYFNGPLSPTFNAGLFRLCGASFSTLVWANLFLTALTAVAVYVLLHRGTRQFAATLATLVLLAGFAFSHLLSDGNYNYITPYSHDITHGLLLSLLMMLALGGGARWRMARLALGGLLLGLVFLTKAEVFLAASGAACAAVLWQAIAHRPTKRELIAGLSVLVLAALVAPLLFSIGLAQHMPWADAWLGVCGTWRWVLTSDVGELYRPMSGFDAPLRHIAAMALSLLATGLILAILAFYDYQQTTAAKSKATWAIIAVLFGCVAALRGRGFPLLLEGGPLLLAALLMVYGYSRAAWRARRDPTLLRDLAALATFAVFALLLLAKMALVPRIIHYGFVLAMPATVLAVAALIHHAPAIVCRRWRGGPHFRRVAKALVVADLLGFVLMSSANVPRKTLLVASGADEMKTYNTDTAATGPVLNQLLDMLRGLPAEATVATFPEGAIVNYWARRTNPTGFTNAMPPELCMFGEANYVAALERTRPDFIVLIDKEMAEYGVGPFGGDDFGHEIMAWIRANYQVRRTLGAMPFAGEGFGIQLLVPRSHARALVVDYPRK